MSTTIAPELAAKAAEAWARMTQPDEPMPAWAALDYLMNDTTDDRQAAKQALHEAALAWVAALCPPQEEPQDDEGHYLLEMFRKRYWRQVQEDIDGKPDDGHCGIRWWYRAESESNARWRAWCDHVEAALALCREIEAAP